VDIRVGSPTFAAWIGVRLSSANGHQLFVPPDFAHGFVVLSERADLLYQCTEFYDSRTEHTLHWNDPRIGIEWPVSDPVLSSKDSRGHSLTELQARNLLPDWRAEPKMADAW
jgi:dTDP-4-dehydrorhamnose 3,5-epimerase